MKTKTNKLKKLERNRYSILTDDLEKCFICGGVASDIHEIYGAGSRKISMANGFCVPLCRNCHRTITLNYGLNLRLKMICQEEYEKTHTRKDWFSLIGKNYLESDYEL